MTLTLPHSGDVARDLRTIVRAWQVFRKALWTFFRHEHGLSAELLARVAFVRVLEVTAGRKDDGHAHLHVYMISPYVPHELARHLWGSALRAHGYELPTRSLDEVLADCKDRSRAQLERVLVTRRGSRGRPLETVDWPVVGIEKCYGDVENELVKYLVKDAVFDGAELKLVDPALYARIYEGLEGLRTIATSRRFFVRSDRVCACEACGSTRISRKTQRRRNEDRPSQPEGSDD